MARPLLNPEGRYSPELAASILDRLREGETLVDICRSKGMPDRRTVHYWVSTNPEFAAAYELARDQGFDAIANDVMRIADQTEHDTIETDRGPKANAEWIARSKLRVWTRMQLLEKWSHRYRPQSGIQLSGHLATSNMTEDEIRDELAALAASGVLGTVVADAGSDFEETPSDGSDLV